MKFRKNETLTCAFGSPWTARGCGPCAKCRAESDRLVAAFWREVFFGRWDADGYTPEERRRKADKGFRTGAAR